MTPETKECTGLTEVTTLISACAVNVRVKIKVDEIIVDLNKNEINCTQLTDTQTFKNRKEAWEQTTKDNGGNHPSIGDADTRLLNRMRNSAVSAIYGAGMHPNRNLWVPNPREIIKSDFVPKNIHRS